MTVACPMCERLRTADGDQTIFRDEAFCVFQYAEVPGWITIASNEHVDGFEGLTGVQAAAFGRLARRVIASLKRATGASRVHMVFLGDQSPHFHFGVFPRRNGQPGLFAVDLLQAEQESSADGDAAATLRRAVRAELMRILQYA